MSRKIGYAEKKRWEERSTLATDHAKPKKGNCQLRRREFPPVARIAFNILRSPDSSSNFFSLFMPALHENGNIVGIEFVAAGRAADMVIDNALVAYNIAVSGLFEAQAQVDILGAIAIYGVESSHLKEQFSTNTHASGGDSGPFVAPIVRLTATIFSSMKGRAFQVECDPGMIHEIRGRVYLDIADGSSLWYSQGLGHRFKPPGEEVEVIIQQEKEGTSGLPSAAIITRSKS